MYVDRKPVIPSSFVVVDLFGYQLFDRLTPKSLVDYEIYINIPLYS